MTHPRARRPRARLRLPRRPPGALRRRPARAPGRAGRPARPQRRRQDHAGAPPQRHPHRGRRQRSRSAACRSTSRTSPEIRRRVGHRLPGPRRPALPRQRCARTSPSARPTSVSRAPPSTQRVMDALDQVGMADYVDRPPHHLSFGQRRRVAVATVLAMEPEILVLDEPSSNLDPASRRELADILRSLDVTVLMVTHDLPYALELCPRSVVLSDGVVVADGRDLRRTHRRRPDAAPTGSSCRGASTRARLVAFPRDQRTELARARDRGDAAASRAARSTSSPTAPTPRPSSVAR